jgi:hypothetical protein
MSALGSRVAAPERLLGVLAPCCAEAPNAVDASTVSGANRSGPAEANVWMLDRRCRGVSLLPALSEPGFDFRQVLHHTSGREREAGREGASSLHLVDAALSQRHYRGNEALRRIVSRAASTGRLAVLYLEAFSRSRLRLRLVTQCEIEERADEQDRHDSNSD